MVSVPSIGQNLQFITSKGEISLHEKILYMDKLHQTIKQGYNPCTINYTFKIHIYKPCFSKDYKQSSATRYSQLDHILCVDTRDSQQLLEKKSVGNMASILIKFSLSSSQIA